MKKVTIKVPTQSRNMFVDGWLFCFAGLRMVAHKDPISRRYWTISEFSTGLRLPTYNCAINTRKAKIETAIEFLRRQTSKYICEAVQEGIKTVGILN